MRRAQGVGVQFWGGWGQGTQGGGWGALGGGVRVTGEAGCPRRGSGCPGVWGANRVRVPRRGQGARGTQGCQEVTQGDVGGVRGCPWGATGASQGTGTLPAGGAAAGEAPVVRGGDTDATVVTGVGGTGSQHHLARSPCAPGTPSETATHGATGMVAAIGAPGVVAPIRAWPPPGTQCDGTHQSTQYGGTHQDTTTPPTWWHPSGHGHHRVFGLVAPMRTQPPKGHPVWWHPSGHGTKPPGMQPPPMVPVSTHGCPPVKGRAQRQR